MLSLICTMAMSQEFAKQKAVPRFPETLEGLVQLEESVQALLPKVTPAVVAIDGGTGVIVHRDGYVLTASHVTKRANRVVSIRLADGRTVIAKTLGTNLNTDTAALKIVDPGPWPYVPMGNSELVDLGTWCVALGYPLSFKRGSPAVVRIGRIHSLDKGRFVTDCTIMGGDSGGPLFDMDGNLIAISSRVKTAINQNLHIPIRTYKKDWPKLVNSIDVQVEPVKQKAQTKAYLGIEGETDNNRVRIRRVTAKSPAALAGFLKDDVILELDQSVISKFDDVVRFLKSKRPGDRIVAKLNRFGNLIMLPVQLGQK